MDMAQTSSRTGQKDYPMFMMQIEKQRNYHDGNGGFCITWFSRKAGRTFCTFQIEGLLEVILHILYKLKVSPLGHLMRKNLRLLQTDKVTNMSNHKLMNC